MSTASETTIAATAAAHQRDTAELNKQESTSSQTQDKSQATTTKAADIAGTTCMELALEGERLCQSGDLKNGVKFFEEAIKVGTSDERTLSAIFSQLGNAYFYLEDYQKALDYHKQDVTLVHNIGDQAAEAKACGNLGNTFKMLGKFDEAAVYCRRYLEISRKLGDEIGEGRALYNLGNVYHMQGKRMIGASEQESGELPHDIKSSLQRAIEYYEANLKVVSKSKDSIAMGRAYGNLGNTHYLLGNFQDAVDSHKKRLALAKQTNDRSAERRAYLNLGNANVFLGNFQEAIENYSETLRLAQELQDRHTEAHSCYSLANTYTFLRNYDSAIEYHLKYLELIKELDDKLGEGRACWSLVNIYQMVNDPELALVYAKRHHDIAELLNDEMGLTSAKANIEELEETIAQKEAIKHMTINNNNNTTTTNPMANSSTSSTNATVTTVREIRIDDNNDFGHNSGHHTKTTSFENDDKLLSEDRREFRPRHHHHHHHHHQQQQQHHISRHLSADKRQEQEQRRFKKQLNSNLADIDGLAAARRRSRSSSTAVANDGKTARGGGGGPHRSNSSERLLDMIEHLQSGRIDDQRCEILKRPIPIRMTLDNRENNEPFNSIETASSTPFAATMTNPKSAVSAAASVIRATYRKASLAAYPMASQAQQSIQSQRRPTVSAEHRDQLFDLIAGAQRQRMDEQRASLPALQLVNGAPKSRPTQAPSLLSREQATNPAGNVATSPSASNSAALATRSRPNVASIPEGGPPRPWSKERSRSIAPTVQGSNIYSPSPNVTTAPAAIDDQTISSRAKIGKLPKQFQTLDSGDNPPPAHDEKFFDSLMRYQSTRFNDQRSEFPKNSANKRQSQQQNNVSSENSDNSGVVGQQNDFLNLIVKLGSDRIDDQRSAPPSLAKGRNF